MRAASMPIVVALVAACRVAPTPPPDGRAELAASREAMLKVTRFTLEASFATDIGEFRTRFEVDCAQGYYHMHKVTDLTSKGIESRATQLQGRPSARNESEELYVGGGSYRRYSGSWEAPQPGYDDAELDWVRHHSSYGEHADCDRIRQEPDLITIPYSGISRATEVAFVGTQELGGTRCNEFRVAYPDTVWGDRMISRDAGDGMLSSEREMVTKPVEATICVGETDKRVYRTAHPTLGGPVVTRLFSYGEITPLPVPPVGL